MPSALFILLNNVNPNFSSTNYTGELLFCSTFADNFCKDTIILFSISLYASSSFEV